MSDFELLQAYVQGGDEDAFTEVVNRYMNLVYSAALRQSSDPHTAAEIVQSVFIILARKASRIQANTIMAGWLLRATRYTANNARRNERYRQQLEQQAMENLCTTESESAWTEIAPVLDEAMILLNEPDRNAIALRFFAHKSYKEIGETLSSSEEGARKRVNRALERLRGLLVRRGTLLSAGAIAGAISAHGVQAAPAQLATPVVSAALAKAAVSVGTLPFLAKATLQTLDRLRLRSLVLRGATASLAVAALILATINVTQRAVAPAAGISRKATTGLKPGQSTQPAAPLAAFPASAQAQMAH